MRTNVMRLYKFLTALILTGGVFACWGLTVLYEANGEDAKPVRVAKKRMPDNPVEVGDVVWSRDLEAALAASRKSIKPVFALFQEVPG